jgi:hypothetical protein
VQNATLNVTPGGAVTVGLTGTGSIATPILISELRFRGPAGGNDEFVEIYNNTDAPIDISGYTLHGSNNAGTNSTRATVPLNTILAARALPLREHRRAAIGATPGTRPTAAASPTMAVSPSWTVTASRWIRSGEPWLALQGGRTSRRSERRTRITATNGSPEACRSRCRTRTTTRPISRSRR